MAQEKGIGQRSPVTLRMGKLTVLNEKIITEVIMPRY